MNNSNAKFFNFKVTFFIFFTFFNIFSSIENNKEISKKEIVFDINAKLENPYKIETVFGDFLVQYKIVDDLLKSFALQRLKSIDQGGPCFYFGLAENFQRYEHSIGVMYLIEKFGGSIMEQVVGLLHDTSHTAFSHLAEMIFDNKDHEKGYQDKIHLAFLKKSGTYEILKKYGIELEDLDPDCGKYNLLERSLPFMCADRIEYNLHTGIVYKILTKEETNSIINDLRYENSLWFFNNKESAKKFALLSLYFTKEVWASDWNTVLYKFFAEGIKRALNLNGITLKMLNYGKDTDIIEKMKDLNDAYIQYIFDCCSNIKSVYKISDEKDYDLFIKNKFRGIDPFTKNKDGNLVNLTSLDEEFKDLYEKCKTYCESGLYIKLLKPMYLK